MPSELDPFREEIARIEAKSYAVRRLLKNTPAGDGAMILSDDREHQFEADFRERFQKICEAKGITPGSIFQ